MAIALLAARWAGTSIIRFLSKFNRGACCGSRWNGGRQRRPRYNNKKQSVPSGYNRKARERAPNPKPLVLGFGLGRRRISSISSWNSTKLLLRQLLEMAAGSRGDPPQHVKPTTSRCVSKKPSLSIAVFFLTDLSLLHPEVWAAHITLCISGCWSSLLHKFAVSQGLESFLSHIFMSS
jgi:hypothetical protein